MSNLLKITLLSAVFIAVDSSVGYEPTLEDLVSQCLMKDLTYGDVDFSVPGICKKYTCVNYYDGSTKSAKVKSKGCSYYTHVPKNCYETQPDPYIPYPDCCPKLQCNKK